MKKHGESQLAYYVMLADILAGMNAFFGSIFWLVVTLGILVTFHEFGHYWVARRCGVKVLRFSVGFGRALYKRIGQDGCEYQIAPIPLGGYVKMLDAREGAVPPELRDQEFTGKPVWQRIAIVAAGPLFNLIFAVAALWLMFVLGKPDLAPIVTAAPHSLAAEAGVRPGDRVLAVNGTAVATLTDTMNEIASGMLGRQPLPLTVSDASGQQRRLVLPLDRLPPGQSVNAYFKQLGLTVLAAPPLAATVLPGEPAAAAGMQPGDRILRINGIAVHDFNQLSHLIREQAERSPRLKFLIQRGEQRLELPVTAHAEALGKQARRWVIGVGAPPPARAILRYGPLRALREAGRSTWNNACQTFQMIAKMLDGEASTSNLSGVIGIAQVAHDSADMGLAWFLNFLAMVSLSLAILNLLPIPILDGGHLLYYLIELIKGSPLSERSMLAGQYVGLILLCALMGLAFYNDIHHIVFS